MGGEEAAGLVSADLFGQGDDDVCGAVEGTFGSPPTYVMVSVVVLALNLSRMINVTSP